MPNKTEVSSRVRAQMKIRIFVSLLEYILGHRIVFWNTSLTEGWVHRYQKDNRPTKKHQQVIGRGSREPSKKNTLKNFMTRDGISWGMNVQLVKSIKQKTRWHLCNLQTYAWCRKAHEVLSDLVVGRRNLAPEVISLNDKLWSQPSDSAT